jgi:putative transposase
MIYRRLMAEADSQEIIRIFEKKKLPSILGTESFIDWVKDCFFEEKKHTEIPKSKLLAPSSDQIKQLVCQSYHVHKEDLLKSRRGTYNEPRNVAIYLTRQLRGENKEVWT